MAALKAFAKDSGLHKQGNAQSVAFATQHLDTGAAAERGGEFLPYPADQLLDPYFVDLFGYFNIPQHFKEAVKSQ